MSGKGDKTFPALHDCRPTCTRLIDAAFSSYTGGSFVNFWQPYGWGGSCTSHGGIKCQTRQYGKDNGAKGTELHHQKKEIWRVWVMWPKWTQIEEPNKLWTGFQKEKGEDREKTGRRPSPKTWEEALDAGGGRQGWLEEMHCPMSSSARDGLRYKVKVVKVGAFYTYTQRKHKCADKGRQIWTWRKACRRWKL